MSRPETPGHNSGSLRFLWLILLCSAFGCAAQERTASFPLRQSIPLGPLNVSVDGWEEVGQAHAPISSLRAPAGEKVIAVFVAWKGLDAYTESDRQVFAEKFLEGRLKLVDSDGFDYKSISAMPRDLYHFSGSSASISRDWVVVFHVWVDSQGYTLRVSHPDSGEEAFDVAIVELS